MATLKALRGGIALHGEIHLTQARVAAVAFMDPVARGKGQGKRRSSCGS